MPYSSNATFLVRGARGRRHPRGLQTAARGTAALGLRAGSAPARGRHVPPQRGDGGRCRPADARARRSGRRGLVPVVRRRRSSEHYFTSTGRPELHGASRLSAFDLVANNTDRKSGHCLLRPGRPPLRGHRSRPLLHAERKLRTVVWEFGTNRSPTTSSTPPTGSSTVPLDIATGCCRRRGRSDSRAPPAWMVKERRFPTDPTGRRYPWPLV